MEFAGTPRAVEGLCRHWVLPRVLLRAICNHIIFITQLLLSGGSIQCRHKVGKTIAAAVGVSLNSVIIGTDNGITVIENQMGKNIAKQMEARVV